jgi:hypothetical protein
MRITRSNNLVYRIWNDYIDSTCHQVYSELGSNIRVKIGNEIFHPVYWIVKRASVNLIWAQMYNVP